MPAQPGKAPVADPEKGRQIVGTVCVACHGADGNSVLPVNPKIAGLPAEYLLKQLADYARPPGDKAGRDNAIMAGMVSAISVDDRLHVAAFLERQAPAPGAATRKDLLQLGQKIYRAGIPDKAVPACAGCHGPTGAGLPVVYPRIGGQHAEYLEAQMKAFRDGTRRNNDSMTQISARLSDAEIKALAEYSAGLRAN